MKLQNHNLLEKDSIGGQDNSTKSGIDAENIAIVFKVVSESLYSNPIGSFIRELTSNAVDAHVDVDEDTPVMIHVYEDDGSNYIEFKDKGTGMSPEVFNKIYMQWFSSDKRATNKKIGGFGIGSKSPLAYVDYFEIITVSNGIKYEYVYSKGEDLPQADLINQYPTEESNGTTIRIEYAEEDKFKVITELRNQLCYFNSVYVKHENYYYDNNFKIYEADNFKVRNNASPFGDAMHICLGQVTYPIDWNILKMEQINIPVAVKFETGDLDVTASREQINYNSATKKAIADKIEIVKHELTERYKKQRNIDDLFKFIKMAKDKDLPPLKIEDVSIPMQGKHNLYFKPFGNTLLSYYDVRDLMNIFTLIVIKNGRKFDKGTESGFNHYLYNNRHLCYINHGKLNYFDTLYINNGYVFKFREFNRSIYNRYAHALKLIDSSDYKSNKTYRIYAPGTAKKVLETYRYMVKYLDSKIQSYNGVAPDHWIKQKKEELASKKEKVKGEITHYTIEGKREVSNLANLIDTYRFIFYICRDEDNVDILHYYHLYNTYRKINPLFNRKSTFLIVSKSNINQLARNNNVIHCENMIKAKSLNNHFLRLRLYKLYNENLYGNYERFKLSSYYRDTFNKVAKLYNKNDYKSRYINIKEKGGEKLNYSVDLVTYFKDHINGLKITKNRKEFLYERELKELVSVVDVYKIFDYITTNSMPKEYLAFLLKKLQIRGLDAIHYNTGKNTLMPVVKEEVIEDSIEEVDFEESEDEDSDNDPWYF